VFYCLYSKLSFTEQISSFWASTIDLKNCSPPSSP
jgi:hypothetical protein